MAGNTPMLLEVAPLLIVVRLEEYDYPGAGVLAVATLMISLLRLFLINLMQRWGRSTRSLELIGSREAVRLGDSGGG